MKRPSFQFYPADWRNNAKLRRCGWAARGVWIELLGLMHDSDEYGVLRWPLKDIAQALGAPIAALRELARTGVLYGVEKGTCESLVYTPHSGRSDGDPVTLIAAQDGPIWYSPRMVRDEYVRARRGANTRFDGSTKHSPKGGIGERQGDAPKPAPKPAPNRRQGDGASSSSSKEQKPAIGNSPPDCESSQGASAPESGGCAAADVEDNPALPAVVRLRKRGDQWLRLTPSNPEIITAIREGVSVEDIEAMAEAYPDKPPLYAIRAARREHAETPEPINPGGPHAARSPSRRLSAVERVEAAIHERRAAAAGIEPAGLPLGADGRPLRQPLDVASG